MSIFSYFLDLMQKDLKRCRKCEEVLEALTDKVKEGKSFSMNICFSKGEFHIFKMPLCDKCKSRVRGKQKSKHLYTPIA